MKYETMTLKPDADYLAPDGSEIRLLPTMKGGGLAHCTLAPGKTSAAVKHKTVEEIWYFIEGQGEVWISQEGEQEVIKIAPGVSVTIPVGTYFQFRNTGLDPLRFLIVTMPPWPGEDEAMEVAGCWDDTGSGVIRPEGN